MESRVENLATEEELSKVEAGLISAMTLFCTEWGTEEERKLFGSSSMLSSLGKVYLHKARMQSGMTQKLSFIKSATLSIAARERFEKLLFKVSEAEEATKIFKDMTMLLLTVCNGRNTDVNFLEISDKISLRLGRIRREEMEFIDSQLQPISPDLSELELRETRKQRIEKVKWLMKTNSAQYIDIMKGVSEECIKALGEPPCKFAVIGLGSLAREEITLYSDFEHIILLQNGIDDSQNSPIREYFRWYSVIFQVIIIGIGETLVPTVGIESLKWFFDLYTRGGVSFDGRFPQACKTPLGVQETSGDEKRVIELIQTVDKMLGFLSSEEKLKNLKDVLLRTCFVHGNQELYTDFQTGVADHLELNSPDIDVEEQSKFYINSVSKFMSGSLEEKQRVRETMDFDKIKDFLYRPATVMVGCLRRIYRRSSGSNFDFFSWFREAHASADLQDLEYALSVACEVRLKLYAKVGHQRRNAMPSDVSKFVGKHCFALSLHSLIRMGVTFRLVRDDGMRFEKFTKCLAAIHEQQNQSFVEADFYDFLGFFEDAITRRKGERNESASSYFAAGLENPDKIVEYFRKAEEILKNSEELEKETFEYAKMMSFIQFSLGRHRDGLEIAERWTKNFRDKKLGFLNDFRYMQIQQTKASCLSGCMKPEEVIEYAKEEMRRSSDAMTQIIFKIAMCDARLQLGDSDGAKLSLQSASLSACACMASKERDMPHDVLLQVTKMIFTRQMRHGWQGDADLTSSAMGMLRPTVQKNTTERQIVKTFPLNERNTELVREWAELEHGEKHPTPNSPYYENVIVTLLLKHGIENFSAIAWQFQRTPPEVLHRNAFYDALNNHISMYSGRIPGLPFGQIGNDLMSAFRTFPEHLESPLFIGTFRLLVIMTLKRSVALKRTVEKIAARETKRQDRCRQSALFKLATSKLSFLHFVEASTLLWRLLNSRTRRPMLAKAASRLLLQVVNVMPFVNLLHYLQRYPDTFVHRHSFPDVCTLVSHYNEAVLDFVKFRFERSGRTLWKTIFRSCPMSSLRRRCVEMLMFAILTVWERDGHLMVLGKKYVISRTSRVLHTAHSALSQDLHFALFLGSADTQSALESAFPAGV